MYCITICRSIGSRGSVILTKTLATLYEAEIPDDLEEIVEEFGGDFYDIIWMVDEENDYDSSEN